MKKMNGLELTKSEKKIARQIIETGLMREYEDAINKVDDIIDKWKAGTETRDSYMKIYSTIKNHDKNIARRYDRMSGSKYLWIIAEQLADGIITTEEIKDFSFETQKKLILMSRIDEKE